MAGQRIIIVDDHPLFRAAIRMTIEGEGTDSRVEEAGGLDELAAALGRDRDCDLVLLDLNIPGVQGFSGLLMMRAQFPEIPIVIVSAVDGAGFVQRALALGASGYLSKSADSSEVRRTVAGVLAGEVVVPDGAAAAEADAEETASLRRLARLTAQQLRVLVMLREGKMNKQIAHELAISEATVKAHVSTILQKLEVDSRTQAVVLAGRLDSGLRTAAFDPLADQR